MSDAAGEQKLLSELRVTELKQELEKRNLDKNGIKIILTDRLEKALLADGHDPATYLFRVNEPVVPSDTNAKQMSPSATPMDTDGEGNLHISENGNAEGDSHETSAQMETDAAPTTKDNDKKVNEMNDSKELIIDDQNTGAAATNDEEMLEDPLVDVPAETTPATAKSADNKITAQPSVKTPVQAPANDDKEKDVASRSIWVRGLTSATKAADLKVLCTQYGKVVRAKIYTSKKQSTSACYGYVTMADSAAADKAAAAMHKTQIKGRIISVEKADKSKVPAVKSATAATTKKDGATSESKRDTEKKGKDEDSKAKVAGEKSQTDAKGKSTAASATSKREETRSSDRKRDDKEKRTSTGDRRDSERPRASDAKRDVARRSAAREPRRGAQRTISAARRFPIRGVSSYSLRGRITRPGDRGAYMSSVRRPEAMSQRDLLTMLRHKEEEHRRREAEIEKERALERERERIRFEREQLEKERLQLQLQAALQQQKLAAMNSSRTKDSYAPSSRGSRHAEYRSSRDSRAEKISSSTSHHRSVADTHRSTTESRSRRGGSSDRADRDRSEHKHTASGAASRERSRHESYGTSSRSTRPASYATTTKEYDRAYASSRGTHSYSNGRGSSSYYGTSRDAYSASARPTYGSSSTWVSGGGSGLGGHSSSTSSWTRGAAGPGGWASFGSTGGASSGVRYDYDKYQQRF
uniref:SAFB-like transcription modulator n=1 Tax=Haemonchus contortus TaxID=6289 RepID=A0A7I5E5S0_HAECO